MEELTAIEPALGDEAERVLGGRPDSIERLTHSSATSGVWRVRTAGRSAVCKILRPDDTEPASMRYWIREALVYRQLPPQYRDAGVRAPALIGRFDRVDGQVAIWLEDVTGVPAANWTVEQFGRNLRRLGRAQGAYLAGSDLPTQPWLSRQFLRRYLAARNPEYDTLLADDAAWRRPSIARHFPPYLRDELRRLRADRDRLLGWVESSPQTFAHLDVWPDNLFEVGEELVLIDWGFAGIGAAGEDPGNLVPDSIFDLRHPASILPDPDRAVFGGYVAGLRDAGWDGDERRIRLAMTATACKYDWIAGATLARAAAETATQPIYGGVAVDAETLFATRAAAMRHLLGWADEARRLAAILGLE